MKIKHRVSRVAWITTWIALVGLLLSGCSQQPKLGSITVKSNVEKATLFVNGEMKGTTPATMEEMLPGEYLLELRKDGFKRAYLTTTLLDGQVRIVSIDMDSVKGLLLVESSPAGADVAIDGVFKGITPLLLADIPLGRYQLELKSSELLPKVVEAELMDRTPKRVFVELASNTAKLTFTSTPAEAEVRIDGVMVGKTPLTIDEVKAGEAEIKISKEGYRPYERKMVFEATKPYEVGAELEALPSGLSIASTPAGVEIMVDNQSVGTTPVTLSDLSDGPHDIVAQLTGYESQTKTVYLEPSVNESVEFEMVKNSGELVVDTEPAGVQIFVDGKLVATTESDSDSDSISSPLSILLKSDQEHIIQFVREGFVSKRLKVQTAIDEVVTKHVVLKRIFVYDTKITTTAGSIIKCRLADKLPNGDLYYERFPGVYNTLRASQVADVKSISLEDDANKAARRLIERSRAQAPAQN